MRIKDYQRVRVYRAQWQIGWFGVFNDDLDTVLYTYEVCDKINHRRPKIKFDGRATSAIATPILNKILFPKAEHDVNSKSGVLHEVAHLISPPFEAHGPIYVKNHMMLVQMFMPELYDYFERYYAKFGVDIAI